MYCVQGVEGRILKLEELTSRGRLGSCFFLGCIWTKEIKCHKNTKDQEETITEGTEGAPWRGWRLSKSHWMKRVEIGRKERLEGRLFLELEEEQSSRDGRLTKSIWGAAG